MPGVLNTHHRTLLRGGQVHICPYFYGFVGYWKLNCLIDVPARTVVDRTTSLPPLKKKMGRVCSRNYVVFLHRRRSHSENPFTKGTGAKGERHLPSESRTHPCASRQSLVNVERPRVVQVPSTDNLMRILPASPGAAEAPRQSQGPAKAQPR